MLVFGLALFALGARSHYRLAKASGSSGAASLGKSATENK